MIDAIIAEALKMRRHRGTWLMVWIYPIAVALIVIGSLAYYAIAGSAPSGPPDPAAKWIAESTLFWRAPISPPGRALVAGFVALLFAGEYSWNTWKLIIPARTRWQLIVAKWVIAVGFVFLALLATNLIVLASEWLRSLQGSTIPGGVTASALFEAHARAAGYSVLAIAYTAAFAGMIAVLTRSILATVIISIVLLFAEGLMPVVAVFLHSRAPDFTVFLVEFLPLYHIRNMINWADYGTGLVLALGPGGKIALSWATSFIALLAWIAGAGAVTMARFMRQDLN